MLSQLTSALSTVKDKLLGWGHDLIVMLPNVVAALLAFGVFVLLARVTRRGAMRLLSRLSKREALNRLAGSVLAFGVSVVGLLVALDILQLEKAVMSLLAGVGVIGLALGFAFQDIASNFMAGVLILARRPFRIGDILRSNDFFGQVEEINLRSTVIRTFSGEAVLLPNKVVFQNPVTNYSRTVNRRVELAFGVSYADDLDKVRRVALQAVSKIDRDRSRDVELFFTGFGDSSIDGEVRFWLDSPDQRQYLRGRSDAVMALKRAFDEHEITIPFPIRTLDFGIKGGEPLRDAFSPRLQRAAKASGESLSH